MPIPQQAIDSFPGWLPQGVGAYALELITSGGLKIRQVDRVERLTTDRRMKFVWCRLHAELEMVAASKCAEHFRERAVDSWLRGYLLVALNGDAYAEYFGGAATAREERDILRRLERLATELITLLGDPLSVGGFTGWDVLARAVHTCRDESTLRDQLDALARATYGRYWSYGAQSQGASAFADEPPPILAPQAYFGDVLPQLDGLRQLTEQYLRQSEEASPNVSKPPNKTSRLTHSVYVRAIARYAAGIGLEPRPAKGRTAGFYLHKIIAITANVALERSASKKISAEYVRTHSRERTISRRS